MASRSTFGDLSIGVTVAAQVAASGILPLPLELIYLYLILQL